MVLVSNEDAIPQLRQERNAWLNKNSTMTLEDQLLAYRQDLRIGRDYCVICRRLLLQLPLLNVLKLATPISKTTKKKRCFSLSAHKLCTALY
jgi:hypothetical protein